MCQRKTVAIVNRIGLPAHIDPPGIAAALASSTLDEDVRGSGLAVITTATNLARFLASVGFGALWTFAGLNTAVLTCGIALVAAILVTALVLRSTREEPALA